MRCLAAALAVAATAAIGQAPGGLHQFVSWRASESSCGTANADPRERPEWSYGAYELFALFISDSGQR